MATKEGGITMAKTQAQMRATKKYDDAHYWRPMLRIPKELEEEVREASEGSINGYIVNLIKADLEKRKDTE